MIDWRPIGECTDEIKATGSLLVWSTNEGAAIASWAYSHLRHKYEWSGGQFGTVQNVTHFAIVNDPN